MHLHLHLHLHLPGNTIVLQFYVVTGTLEAIQQLTSRNVQGDRDDQRTF